MSSEALEVHDDLPGVPSPAQSGFLVGHHKQVSFLLKAWRSRKMHHALLFEGPQGIGKATLAFHFARHIVMDTLGQSENFQTASTGDPIMHQIAIGAHPQVLHLTRPLDVKTQKFKTQLTVDETRRINSFLSHTIPGNGWRVIIVDPVNDMNANAANALLKNLEEPRPRTLFMLIAQSAGRLLPTIRSRCLHLRFEPLEEDLICKGLEELGLAHGNDKALLAAHAGGSLRRAAVLAEGGALEIISALEKVFDSNAFEGGAVLKIGDAISTREAEPLFFLVCEHLLSKTAQLATVAAQSGRSSAKVLAEFHSQLANSLGVTTGYNLDKRQFLLEAMRDMHELFARP